MRKIKTIFGIEKCSIKPTEGAANLRKKNLGHFNWRQFFDRWLDPLFTKQIPVLPKNPRSPDKTNRSIWISTKNKLHNDHDVFPTDLIAVSHQRSEVLAVTNINFIFLSEEYMPSTENFRLALPGSPISQCDTPGNNAQPDGCQCAKLLDGGTAECMALYFETANSCGLPTAPKDNCGHNLLHLNSLKAALGECLKNTTSIRF